jgi:hypothetical protein
MGKECPQMLALFLDQGIAFGAAGSGQYGKFNSYNTSYNEIGSVCFYAKP